MLKEAVNGIAQAIYEALGEEYEIYKNKIKQGLNEPCFLITPITTSHDHVVMNRYERTYSFIVQYFPKEEDYADEVADIEETLMDALEIINIDGEPHRGSNMSAHVVDDVLNFSVDYKLFIMKQAQPEETMEELGVSVGLKG